MAFSFRKIFEGLNLVPKASSTAVDQGDLEVSSVTGKLTYHNGTSPSPVVTEAHTATLTNKSIDADANTITNIENADIKVGANIARTKLASGTPNHIVTNDGSGVMSSTATISAAQGGTGQDLSAATGVLHVNAGTFSASNVVNADVDSAAAIARSKLGTGTASHVVINDGSGNFSSEAQLAVSRGGTGLSSLGTANQVLGVNSGATAAEYKTIVAGANVAVVHGAGTITISSGSAVGSVYDAIVGNAADVLAGRATHSSITSAIAAVSSGQCIRVLARSFTENITLSKNVAIEGSGYGSVLNGTFTFATSSDYSYVTALYINGASIDINSGVSGVNISNIWSPSTCVITDSGTGSYIHSN